MGNLIAYEATSEGEKLSGGSVSYGDGETLDVVAALEAGGGTIVVHADSAQQHALETYPAVKRTAVPSGAEPITEDPSGAPDASVAAVAKAQELDVNLHEVDGTGAGGKITVDDVKAAADAAASSAAGATTEEG